MNNIPQKTNTASNRKGFYAKIIKAFLINEPHNNKSSNPPDRIKILDVDIDNFTLAEFLGCLDQGVVFTPNVDHIMKLRRDPEFRAAYALADYRICDSQILLYSSRLLGIPIKAKISGSDLLPLFCDHHATNAEIKIFLLGGAEGVAEKARQRINARVKREIIVTAHSPSFGFEKNEHECQNIIDMINASSANVLVVGVGAPKQEKWIAKHRAHLSNISIVMAVGAAIDFEAGNKSRSPQLMSVLGIEWLYRLLSEPQRLWKRYLIDDLPFLGLVIREAIIKSINDSR